MLKISKKDKNLKGIIHLTASKSESNRVLIIQALTKEKIEIKNLAIAEDTVKLKQSIETKETTVDVGPAGTAMRFLTAYFACTSGEKILTGSERMKKRPIGILVDALRKLGADIEYMENDGYPPLKIKGRELNGGDVEIEGKTSSQFISALLLIAPILKKGIRIQIIGELISMPYLKMTTDLMKYFGAKISWDRDCISVSPSAYKGGIYMVEADWSAASYWYEIAAMSDDVNFSISGLKKDSLQGDSVTAKIFEFFGVSTTYFKNKIQLTKTKESKPEGASFDFDFTNCPDIAQTIAATMSGLKIKGVLTGLSSLRIKETDRINALQNELEKFGVFTRINNLHDLIISDFKDCTQKPIIKTYEDHRMAMAFAPLVLKTSEIYIEHPEVVKKSYPDYWNDLKSTGFKIDDTF